MASELSRLIESELRCYKPKDIEKGQSVDKFSKPADVVENPVKRFCVQKRTLLALLLAAVLAAVLLTAYAGVGRFLRPRKFIIIEKDVTLPYSKTGVLHAHHGHNFPSFSTLKTKGVEVEEKETEDWLMGKEVAPSSRGYAHRSEEDIEVDAAAVEEEMEEVEREWEEAQEEEAALEEEEEEEEERKVKKRPHTNQAEGDEEDENAGEDEAVDYDKSGEYEYSAAEDGAGEYADEEGQERAEEVGEEEVVEARRPGRQGGGAAEEGDEEEEEEWVAHKASKKVKRSSSAQDDEEEVDADDNFRR